MAVSLLAVATVIVACVIFNKISSKLGIPALLAFILLGMFFGTDGVVKIEFDNYSFAYKICTVATIIASIFIICATVPSNFQVSPLPTNIISLQNESMDAEETETVYISTYGECYHSNPRCSGMKYARSVTLEAAQKAGRRACSKCYRKKR